MQVNRRLHDTVNLVRTAMEHTDFDSVSVQLQVLLQNQRQSFLKNDKIACTNSVGFVMKWGSMLPSHFHALTFGYTSDKWIAGVTNWTWTNRIVIDNLTACVLATHRYAWIDALLIDARTILCTLWANDAFGTTVWRTANVIGQTWADNVFVYDTALTVQAAWRRRTRIDRNVISCTEWRQ